MATQTKCRILIVDDEVLIRQGIKYYIDWEKEGFEIIGEASNGKEALDIIEVTQPHILLTDIVMPIMDGEELTRIVKERFPSIEIIILSSFSEYDYVRSTFQNGVVDYILKPKLDSNELRKVLHRAKKKVPDLPRKTERENIKVNVSKMIERMILGYDVLPEETDFKHTFPYPSFYLGIVNYSNESVRSSFQTKIEASLENLNNQSSCYFLSIDKHKELMLINLEKEAAITIRNEMQGFLNATFSDQVILVLSSLYMDFTLTKDIYKKEIEKSFLFPFYYPEENFIIAEQWLDDVPQKTSFNQEWFNNEWKKRRFDSALDYLERYAQDISTCYVMNIPEFKAFFNNSIFHITILLTNMEYEVKMLEEVRYRYIQNLDQAPTAKETISFFHKFIEEVRECLKENQKPQVSENMKRLIEYVEDHFAEALNLTELASHFHFNPSYLSNYFSTHYKESFIEFLNRVRIEEATKLLRNRNISIAEISGLVGYADHSYFCKVFKKQKGMSPSNYRRKTYIGD